MTQDELKRRVAEAALAYVPAGALIGVGSGSTVNLFIDALARLEGEARIAGAVSSSAASTARLVGHGILVSMRRVARCRSASRSRRDRRAGGISGRARPDAREDRADMPTSSFWALRHGSRGRRSAAFRCRSRCSDGGGACDAPLCRSAAGQRGRGVAQTTAGN